MAKIKKYQDAANSLKLGTTYGSTGGWNYGFGQDNSGMVNPGNQALQQYTTTSSSSIPTGALPTSGNISQVAYNTTSKVKPKGMGFKGFMGKYGGAISSAASALAPLLMKKPDPNERPYKKGTDMIKSKKRNLIKYQGGTNATDIIGPGPMDKLKEFTPEQIASFNAYENKRDNNIAIDRVNAMGIPVSPLTPRMASLNIPQQAPMSVRPSSVPAPEKLSRRERKQENEKQFKMLNRQDAEYMTPRTPTLGGNIPDRKPLN